MCTFPLTDSRRLPGQIRRLHREAERFRPVAERRTVDRFPDAVEIVARASFPSAGGMRSPPLPPHSHYRILIIRSDGVAERAWNRLRRHPRACHPCPRSHASGSASLTRPDLAWPHGNHSPPNSWSRHPNCTRESSLLPAQPRPSLPVPSVAKTLCAVRGKNCINQTSPGKICGIRKMPTRSQGIGKLTVNVGIADS
jgi:hypothetical protein